MRLFCRETLAFVFSVLVFSTSVAADKENYYRSFWQPEFNSERLDYCTLDKKECGLAVANKYCRIMGYDRADQQLIANNVGLTTYLGTDKGCQGWRCNGFKTIRCVSKMSHKPPKPYHYRYRRFVFPRFNNYRVDWCYDGKTGCGKRAAYSFCRQSGYLDVKDYSVERGVNATKAIGNQKLCFGKECNGFSKIDCFR
ncbi:hypothetical protein ACFORL_11250 [Legionella dresdenensis]|uniref:Uncharacterized protein n=1 Tax=Legionella dresdenensis TaxID=450200 RepID=A0ABV8CHX7_9GAMM